MSPFDISGFATSGHAMVSVSRETSGFTGPSLFPGPGHGAVKSSAPTVANLGQTESGDEHVTVSPNLDM